jgi:hypothetical protein
MESLFEESPTFGEVRKRKLPVETEFPRRLTKIRRTNYTYKTLQSESGDAFKFLLFNDTEIGLNTLIVQK